MVHFLWVSRICAGQVCSGASGTNSSTLLNAIWNSSIGNHMLLSPNLSDCTQKHVIAYNHNK